MEILQLFALFALVTSLAAVIGAFCCLLMKKCKMGRSQNEHKEENKEIPERLDYLMELGQRGSRITNKDIIACPITLDSIHFDFMVFSSERQKTIASKTKDTTDPSIESFDFPKEFHSSTVIDQNDKTITVFCYGGQDKEHPHTNCKQAVMILKFTREGSTVFQEPTLVAGTFQAHSTSQSKGCVKGSSFDSISMASVTTYEKKVYLFGGFDFKSDAATQELYAFYENNSEWYCQHFPSPLTVMKAGLQSQRYEGKLQTGDVPSERMGHCLYSIQQNLVLIGGHYKKWSGGKISYRNCTENIYIFNPINIEWEMVSVINGDPNLLQRSLFMSAESNGVIYLAGGSLYLERKVNRLNICQIVVVKVNAAMKTASIEQIQINVPPILISSGTMTKEGSKLYLFGGVEEQTHNGEICNSGKFLEMNLDEKTLSKIEVKPDIKQLIQVYGSSSFWFGNHTLIIFSGTRPPLGTGFRAILSYTKLSLREMLCAAEICLIYQQTGNVPWTQCDECDLWYHNFCDAQIRKREQLRKNEKYVCAKCRGKELA